MAAEILDLPLGVTAWREIINYNFALLNAQGGGIPVYATVPSTKQEELIFVVGVGFMEWKTNVNPAAYVKNLILTTQDLIAFANGAIPNIPSIQYPVLGGVQPGIYPIFQQNLAGALPGYNQPVGTIAHSYSIRTGYGSYTMLVGGKIRATFSASKNGQSGQYITTQLRLNGTNLTSANNATAKSMDITVIAGDVISIYDGGSTSGGEYYPPSLMLYVDINSIIMFSRIAVPSSTPYVIHDYNYYYG
ncbi:MAG: hypothetical protein LBL65_05520 [Campylobacteraceae bacterium]|jgi:hypothetical protein|nr:hypothetical protein [Campylobacteraceae bacterium]